MMATGPRVHLDAEAASWLAARGGVVTLRPSPRHGCCGGTALLPVAEARTPEQPEGWLLQEVDGIRIYIDPAMAAHPGVLTIRVEGFLRWRRLFGEGAGLNAGH